MPGLVSRDVPTTLNYLAKTTDGAPPYNYTFTPPAGQPNTNIVPEGHPVTIHDARGHENELSTDLNGFAFVKAPAKEKLFEDEDAITKGYYLEVEELLKRELGAKRVVIFDHTIRCAMFPLAFRALLTSIRDTVSPRALSRTRPSCGARPWYVTLISIHESRLTATQTRVHVDQTLAAGVQRVQRHLGEEAEHYLKGRCRIVNVWRPIENIVAHEPLAVADYRTIDIARDLVSTRHIYQDREGATYGVKHAPGHKWFYLSDQTPDEVILIKCWDSDESVARLTPHTAFKDATSPTDAPHRQSIEVRCLIFDQE
jgi:hypothetical protein